MSAILFLWTNRKIIFAAFLVVLFFSLWFTIERMSDRIKLLEIQKENIEKENDDLKAKIKNIENEKAVMLSSFTKRIDIEKKESLELYKNEKCCYNPDSVSDRLNEIFGFCAESEK